MNKGWYILFSGMLWFLCTAKSCSTGEEAAQQRSQIRIDHVRDSIKSAASPDTLAEPVLRVFELSAASKLHDLFDYMAIVRDSSTDSEFRTKAGEMMVSLLIPGTTVPESCFNTRPDSVWCHRPLSFAGNGLYTGELGFSQNRMPAGLSASGVAFFQVKKQMMVFGADTIPAWRVLLGEIK